MCAVTMRILDFISSRPWHKTATFDDSCGMLRDQRMLIVYSCIDDGNFDRYIGIFDALFHDVLDLTPEFVEPCDSFSTWTLVSIYISVFAEYHLHFQFLKFVGWPLYVRVKRLIGILNMVSRQPNKYFGRTRKCEKLASYSWLYMNRFCR